MHRFVTAPEEEIPESLTQTCIHFKRKNKYHHRYQRRDSYDPRLYNLVTHQKLPNEVRRIHNKTFSYPSPNDAERRSCASVPSNRNNQLVNYTQVKAPFIANKYQELDDLSGPHVRTWEPAHLDEEYLPSWGVRKNFGSRFKKTSFVNNIFGTKNKRLVHSHDNILALDSKTK